MGEVAVWSDEVNGVAEFGCLKPITATTFGNIFDAESELVGGGWWWADWISAKTRWDFVVDFDCNELTGKEVDRFGGFESELENIVSECGVRFDDCLVHFGSRKFWRRHPDSNRGITVLQTAALTTWPWRREEENKVKRKKKIENIRVEDIDFIWNAFILILI